MFDRVDVWFGNIPTERSSKGRVIHAVGFEFTLMPICLPFIVRWMDISILAAFTLDLSATCFVVIYTFMYTLAYDKIFPVEQPARLTQEIA
ncbi:MAG: chlorhexidine efflux transporter [Pseudomonadota bacterium]